MSTPKLFRAKPPVMYRWLRRRRYFPHAVILACLFFFLPIGVLGGVKVSGFVATNKAMAATRAMTPEHDIADIMSEKERAEHAAVLSGLIIEKPETIGSLIGNDFLVMFREPDLKRSDGKARIFQYRTDSCVLDVFLSDNSDDATVAHYEIRQRKIAAFTSDVPNEQDVDVAGCLKSIYEQRSI